MDGDIISNTFELSITLRFKRFRFSTLIKLPLVKIKDFSLILPLRIKIE